MSAARKFLFDLSFDAAQVAPPEEPPQPQPTVTEAELALQIATAREAAYAEGRAAGLAEAAASREARIAETLDRAAESLRLLVAEQGATAAAMERRAIELTLDMARRIVPALARRNALDEIAGLVGACLKEALDEPRVVLRVADGDFEGMRQRIEKIAEATGFAGKVVILADEALGEGDCRVEWADGGAERDTRRTWREIEAAMARALDATPIEKTVAEKTLAEKTQ